LNDREISTNEVVTQVRNVSLVKKRRRQIVDTAIQLFIKDGYHKTTTRALAKALGCSTGSLYEYISSKEDILYLVGLEIYSEVEQATRKALACSSYDLSVLRHIICEYFCVCNRMGDQLLLLYKFINFLPAKRQKKVLEAEIRITKLFVETISQLKAKGVFMQLSEEAIELISQNISVLGQSWVFRRWYYAKRFTFEQYIEFQSAIIMGYF
jgi:TetR/AcrR family transcriptional regulator, cholesterol catabolism regulator